MNKKGFTLVELLAVLVLIVLVMLLIVPSVKKLSMSNQRKEYSTYEDMMIQYTKTIPNYKNKSYVCLKELKMQSISESIDCNGYVVINNNNLKSYLMCKDTNNNIVYRTTNFKLPSDC